MQSIFANAERVLAAVAGLALFALNDVRMFHWLPHEPGNGRTHALALQLFGTSETVYVGTFDLALRWGLAGLTAATCMWALAETLKPSSRAPE
jgi:hypothetical protein